MASAFSDNWTSWGVWESLSFSLPKRWGFGISNNLFGIWERERVSKLLWYVLSLSHHEGLSFIVYIAIRRRVIIWIYWIQDVALRPLLPGHEGNSLHTLLNKSLMSISSLVDRGVYTSTGRKFAIVEGLCHDLVCIGSIYHVRFAWQMWHSQLSPRFKFYQQACSRTTLEA